MSEYTENVGRRVEYRRQRILKEAECQALRDSLRRALPLDLNIHELDGEIILNTALAFNQNLAELSEIDKKLTVLKSVLGE